MTQATLIPNIKIVDEYGALFPTAKIWIEEVTLSDVWSMKSEKVDTEYQEEGGAGSGSFKVWYYCSEQAQKDGAPLKPLRTWDGERFDDVLIIDEDAVEIQQLMANPAAKKDKATAIVRKDLELRFR